jgi:hypothetical protein
MERVSYEKNTVQDLLNFHKAEELELNPWYQRRAVWTPQQKGYLINTILENKPVPTIYVRHTLDIEKEKSLREVVDGQQRLRSIIGFKDGEFSARHPNYKAKKFYSELKGPEKEQFLMTSLSVAYLIGATESDVIEIFGRINSVSKTLNPQEKRNAQFSGEYKQFTVRMAAELLPIWRTRNIFSATDISRMAEVEFVADLGMNFVLGLQDYSPAKLVKFYSGNDQEFPALVLTEKQFREVFGVVASLDVQSVRDTIFSRPPVLFSLCMVIKDHLDIPVKKINSVIGEIENLAKSDAAEMTNEVSAFVNAITSSTQRIASRRVRDKFIRDFFV